MQVLVLQVGRFQYHQNSLQKICAPVEHPMQLQLGKEMLTQDARRQCSVYNLVAKVVHHGALLPLARDCVSHCRRNVNMAQQQCLGLQQQHEQPLRFGRCIHGLYVLHGLCYGDAGQCGVFY